VLAEVRRYVLDGSAWLCYGSGKESSADMQMDGTDMGEYSTIDFTRYVFPCYLLWKCTEKQEHAGNIEIGVVIHRGIKMWYLCFFLYIHLSTDILILVG